MERYRKYFLQHSLWLEDGFCSYYVQDSAWGRQEILDVEAVTFDWADDAQRWLHQCADHDHSRTLNRLRAYLADHCQQYYHLHRMNDRQVLSAAAREMTRQTSRVVIEPRMGWAVMMDARTARPVQPISVEPSPDMDGLLSELRQELNVLVAEQQKKYDAYEAQLSQMNDVEKAAFYGKADVGAFVENTVGSIWDLAKALPGIYPDYLKALWRVASTPARMAAATARSITTGTLNPLQKEIDTFVNPMALTWEQAARFKSILTILFSNPDTYHLLHDFSQRYWDATHPVERTKMAVNAASDILVTILLAIFTAGIGAAANVAAKSGRLIRVAKLMERVALTLKKISPRSRLTGKARKAAEKLGIGKKARSKAKKGIPDVKNPKALEKLDDAAKKGYGDGGKKVGPKKKSNTRKGFKGPKEAYDHVNSLKDDTVKIAKQRIQGLSKEEAGRLKAEIREWTTKEDYPGIDHSKIDKIIDKYSGRELTKKDIDAIKDYVFKDEFLSPKSNMPKEVNDAYIRQADKWLKLMDGKGGASEQTFLKHELAEMAIKKQGGLERLGESIGKEKYLTHDDVHTAVEQIFDCTK